jgi:hypothetical protein
MATTSRIKKAFNSSLQTLHEAFSQVVRTVTNISTTGERIKQSSAGVTQGAFDQASSVQEASRSLDQIASQARQIAGHMEQVREIAARAKPSVGRGPEAMTHWLIPWTSEFSNPAFRVDFSYSLTLTQTLTLYLPHLDPRLSLRYALPFHGSSGLPESEERCR